MASAQTVFKQGASWFTAGWNVEMTATAHTVANDWHMWLGFFGASIAISFSPGAGAVQSMASGLTHGLLRAYWSIVGQELGLVFQLNLVAVGLGAVVASPS